MEDVDFIMPEEEVGEEVDEDVLGDPDEDMYFSFNGSKKRKSHINLSKINQAIRTIDDNADSETLSQIVMDTATEVKKYRMAPKVKQNRINFFATIR